MQSIDTKATQLLISIAALKASDVNQSAALRSELRSCMRVLDTSNRLGAWLASVRRAGLSLPAAEGGAQ